MRHLELVTGITEDRTARDRAQLLVDLAEVQEMSMEKLTTRYFDWQRLGDAANEAATIFTNIEQGAIAA